LLIRVPFFGKEYEKMCHKMTPNANILVLSVNVLIGEILGNLNFFSLKKLW